MYCHTAFQRYTFAEVRYKKTFRKIPEGFVIYNSKGFLVLDVFGYGIFLLKIEKVVNFEFL